MMLATNLSMPGKNINLIHKKFTEKSIAFYPVLGENK
jgi:hypothetical protein